MLDSNLHFLYSPIKSATDFLYCHSMTEKDDGQVRVAFKGGASMNKMEILQSSTGCWILALVKLSYIFRWWEEEERRGNVMLMLLVLQRLMMARMGGDRIFNVTRGNRSFKRLKYSIYDCLFAQKQQVYQRGQLQLINTKAACVCDSESTE